MSRLWVEKYRPDSVNGYVFRDQRLKNQVESWIKEKHIGHILLSGGPGTGKSTLARILINELEVNPADVMVVNMSSETGVDTVRDKIVKFASTIPRGDYKVIVLEEFDYASINSMASLRNIMETYEKNAKFILTCNYINKIIPAIRSRTQEIEIQKLDEDNFRIRCAEILATENVDFDLDTLDTYIKASYPDLRKCINTLQLNTQNSTLNSPESDSASTSDWQIHAIDLFKKGRITEGRKLICSQIRPEEADDFFRLCYRNLDWWGKTEEQQENAIILIRNAIVSHVGCSDPEINISALLCELARISK